MKVIVLTDMHSAYLAAFVYNKQNLRNLIRVLIEENQGNTILDDDEIEELEAALADSEKTIDELDSLIPKGRTIDNMIEVLEVGDELSTDITFY